jgi:hypothetical protein
MIRIYDQNRIPVCHSGIRERAPVPLPERRRYTTIVDNTVENLRLSK